MKNIIIYRHISEMQKHSLRILFISFFLFFAFSCKKDEKEEILPTIQLSNQYVYRDTSFAAGHTFQVKIMANANGGENLTQIFITSGTQTVFNMPCNASQVDTLLSLTKDAAENQTFVCNVRNSAGKSASVSISITKNGVEYKPIIHYNNIVMGAQSNSLIGSFFSLDSNKTYLLEDAWNQQSIINFVYFFDAVDLETLASPGANITGIYSGNHAPDYWTVRNTIYYSRTALNITTSEFDNCTNDSLIIAHFFSDPGRKAKQLSANQIWGIKKDNLYGLIKITQVNSGIGGSIQFEIKLQQ